MRNRGNERRDDEGLNYEHRGREEQRGGEEEKMSEGHRVLMTRR